MAMNVVKRNGETVKFDRLKIEMALQKAADAVGDILPVRPLADSVINRLNAKEVVGVEEIQEEVEDAIIASGRAEMAKAYIRYRLRRQLRREVVAEQDKAIRSLLAATSLDNANVSNGHSGKMLQIAEDAVKRYALAHVFSAEAAGAHKAGDVYIHDLGHALSTVNCLQLPFGKMVRSGFNTGHGFIRPPKRLASAASLAAIALQSSQNDMFGGQSIPNFDSALAELAATATEREAYQAMEALVFNLNTMHSRAGAQVPFSSLNFGLDTTEGGRRVSRNLLAAYDAGLGKGEPPIFPNLLFKVKAGVNRYPGDPNYDLFQQAMRVAGRRMNPTFVFCDAECNAEYDPAVINYMGCRTRVVTDVLGESVSESRGNLFFISLNLPRLGIEAKGDIDRFFQNLAAKTDLCIRHLLERFEVVSKLKVKDLPFVMGQGLYLGSEGLKPEDSILPAIAHGTLAVGFIGLAECLKALVGKHHGESEEAAKLGYRILAFMKDRLDVATAKYRLNFSLFATPAEGLSGRFTAIDKERYGVIEGVTDREFYTNSFHVPVYYPISHAAKMSIEGRFHALCLGGHIAYCEFTAPPYRNIGAVERLLNHMSDSGVGYAGINFPIDRCPHCGFEGVINGNECPACGGGDIVRIRRITGYLSDLRNFNPAKAAEVRERTASHI